MPAPNRTAIIAAIPEELKPLVRGWQHELRNGVHLWRHRFNGGEWVAACAGTGADAGTRAFAAIESDGPIHRAISVGWAGALQEKTIPGQVYQVAEVIDARTGERFPTSLYPVGLRVVTSPVVAGEQQKQRLAAAYHADLVDMEGAIVARLAAMRAIPFQSIKGVSDGLHDHLPDFNNFIAANGQIQMPRFILFAILRPWYWRALVRMGENSRKAAQGISRLLRDILDH